MLEFEMIKSSYFDAPDLFREHATFPHLTDVECDDLNRFAAISEEAFVTSLMRSTTPDGQRLPYMIVWPASSPRRIGEV